MSSRRAEPDVEWDFSFVGAPAPARRPEQQVMTEPDTPSDEWDFSFAGPRNDRAASGPDRGNADRDVSWDFSFVGDVRRQDTPTPSAVLVDGATWDFSFVDGEEPVMVPSAVEASEQIDDADLELADWPPPATSPSGEIPRIDEDPTNELPRDDRLELDETPASTLRTGDARPDTVEPAVTDTTTLPVVQAAGPIKILTICTHNRTRSVMTMGLLQAGFDRALGKGAVMVRSLGFGPEGEPPIDDAVDEMRERGIDVAGHGSMQVTAERVAPADLVLTAEKDHVVKVADADPDAFRRTFTLPEFCRAIAADPVPGGRSLREWVHSMSSARTPGAYLGAEVPEVDDPTGQPKRLFAAATETIESMCDTVVELLTPAIEPR